MTGFLSPLSVARLVLAAGRTSIGPHHGKGPMWGAIPNPGPAEPPQGQVVQGRNFTFLLPAGWRVIEEGNFALVLQSYDQSVGIIVYGVSGMGQFLTPPQFAYSAVMHNMRLAPDAQISNPVAIQPMPGYNAAAVMDIAFTRAGPQGHDRIVGLVISNVVSVYDRSDAYIAMALAVDRQWGAVQSWLPQVAMRALNTGPNPFGRHEMSQGMMNDTVRQREMYGQYLNWSQQNWAGVVAERAASLDRQAQANGENLSGQFWSQNPYSGHQQRFSNTPSVTWVHRDGRVLESPNPTFDPRTPFDNDWQRIQR